MLFIRASIRRIFHTCICFALVSCGSGAESGGVPDAALSDALDSTGDLDVSSDAIVDAASDVVSDLASGDGGPFDGARPLFDGGLDFGVFDGGPTLPLVSTDTLRVSPGSVQLKRDGQRCLTLSVLHEDGSTSRIGSAGASISVRNVAVAEATHPGDCPGMGVFGTGAGATTAEVTVTSGEVVLRTVVGIITSDELLSLRLLDEMRGVVGLVTEAALYGANGQPVPHLIQGFYTVPSLADVTAYYPVSAQEPPGLVIRVTGATQGRGELHVVYGVADQTRDMVLGQIQILSAAATPLLRSASFGVPAVFGTYETLSLGNASHWTAPGCYPVFAGLFYQENGAGTGPIYSSEITIASSTDAAVVTQGSPPSICLSENRSLDLRVCFRGQCENFAAVIGDPRSVVAVTASPNRITLTALPNAPDFCSGCVQMEVLASMMDGTTRNITGDPAVTVNGVPGQLRLMSASASDLCFAAGRTTSVGYINYGYARAELSIQCSTP